MKENKELEIITVPQDDKGTIEIVPFGTDERIKLSVAIVQKMIAVPTRTGKLPDAAQCIKFMMLCQARHLNPFESDCFMLGYDTQSGAQFSLITGIQVFYKRAEASKGFDGIQSGVVIRGPAPAEPIEREGDIVYAGEELLGGWAKVYRKDRQFPFYRTVKLSTFNTGRSRWEKDPAGMISKCASAAALRIAFPTHLGGLYLNEELPPIDVGPVIERAKIPKINVGPVIPKAGDTIPIRHPSEVPFIAEKISATLPVPAPAEAEEPTGVNPSVAREGAERNSEPLREATDSRGGQTPPKKKPVLKRKASSPSNNVPPFQKEILAKLKLGNRTPQDLLKVAIDSGWCGMDETWPLPEEKLELFLDVDNWLVLTEAMDALPASVMEI